MFKFFRESGGEILSNLSSNLFIDVGSFDLRLDASRSFQNIVNTFTIFKSTLPY